MLKQRPACAVPLAAVGGALLLAVGAPPSFARPAPESAPVAGEHRSTLDRYCVTCHNDRLRIAGLELDAADIEAVGEDAATWEKVVRKLRTRTMPPSPRPRPDEASYAGLVAYLEAELDRAAEAAPDPGRRPALHRLNRAEYANAVRDLLALEIDAAALLPPDDASYGFDNIGDVLRVSPALLDGYLDAARTVATRAIGERAAAVEQITHRVPPDLTQDRRLDGLPFGTRGGARIERYFPVGGEYDIQVRLQRNFIGGRIMGLTEPHQVEITVDGERVELFTVGGPRAPSEAEAGDAAARRRPEREADAGLRIRVPLQAGRRVIGVSFLDRPASQVEGARLPYLRSFAILGEATEGLPHVDTVTITGPHGAAGGETPSRARIFACRPASRADEPACARSILTTLARRAYRRPVTEGDVATLLDFFAAGRRDGGFEAGVRLGLQRLLMSPDFIFRVERDPVDAEAGTAYVVSDLELASRLSFFLWSSAPDDELLALADGGRLREPGILEAEVRRMLRDDRASALVDNFAGQWLHLRNVPHAVPDTRIFPDFDDNLRAAMRRETELLFETIVREDRSVLDLLGARYTFVNERLARHYGIPGIYGSRFRRIPLADDSARGGLLGQASIQMVTSYPNRTSPVLRGKWLLENVLGTAPPDPPADVPPIEETTADGQPRSMREAMVQHRANPACASCHQVLDPLGFGMEHFDAVGAWRDTDGPNVPVDATGTLPGGARFDGPSELREALLRQPESFVRVVAERLLTYALGRGVEHYDLPAVRAVARSAAQDDYRFSTLVMSIVESVPFQMRRTPS
ncbi:MAG: DUF1592 domain-containing protein [Acidobacteria bacterium]|nr:DUF1592 domain-containing protein [Acidobacteriota bacterium]